MGKKLIRDLRKQKKISQAQMAKDLGISNVLLNKIEKQITEPKVNRALKIANYLEEDVNEIEWKNS